MIQPPLRALALRLKSESRKARPLRICLARGSSCHPPSSVKVSRASWYSGSSRVPAASCRLIACWTRDISGEVAQASSRIVSSPAGADSWGRNPRVIFFSRATRPSSGDASPKMSEKRVDFPAPFGPTRPIRSSRLIWRETSLKSVRPAKDLLS